MAKLSSHTPPMMSIILAKELPTKLKPICANIKQKCAKITHKLGSVHTSINANLPMDSISYLWLCQGSEKNIEQKSVNHFGEQEFAVMEEDANFHTTKPRQPRINCLWGLYMKSSKERIKGQVGY